jgi:N-(2-amino-2-carboxyethyl)-L-glutamate synthase
MTPSPVGGSTGTVVSGVTSRLTRDGVRGVTAVPIAPDLGERCLGTVSNWVEDLHGQDVLDPADLSTAHRPG